MFPQLIAGPIIKYKDLDDQLGSRNHNVDRFASGARRFVVGLAKKLLLANNLGLLVDTAFKLESSSLSVASAWLAACAYLMQTPKAASEPVMKLLKSAAANAENNHNMDPDNLYVSETYANPGPTLKRFMPRAQGRAYRINKRTSHITIVVKERD